MSHAEKSAYYQELKAAGVTFDRTYQQYTTDELANAVSHLRARLSLQEAAIRIDDAAPTVSVPNYGTPDPVSPIVPGVPIQDGPVYDEVINGFQSAGLGGRPHPAPRSELVRDRPDTEAGIRTNAPDSVRIDENGLIWHQDEVRKPPYPKPRTRRRLQYNDPGTKTVTVKSGDYLESFEVAGDRSKEAEVKITLPSYQVGCYTDPRFPFKIHVYNERRGFDLFDVQTFYKGPEMVPEEVKLIYVENVLCYDIRTTIRAIETEHRQLELAKSKGI